MSAAPPDMPPANAMDLHDRAALLASGERSSEDLTRDALAAADRLNPALNAFIEIHHDAAIDQARASDQRRSNGRSLGPLDGLPIALKDNICLAHGRTTCASRFLESYRSPYTATAAQRLIDAGIVVVGKTNMDEFAMGSSTENSAFGPTRNPHDPSRVPGGSSGGSAAAVGANIVAAALGSDTGGSIRQPAAFCGCVGLKPTYGRVSRWGLVAYASSLDQIGPITRSLRDAALLLSVIAGHDPLDSTSAPASVAPPCPSHAPSAPSTSRPEPPTIGLPRAIRNSTGNHPAVNAALESAAHAFESAGARIVEIDLPDGRDAIAAYYIIACAEASSNLARFDGVRYGRRADIGPSADLEALYRRSRTEGFGPEVQRRIMLGTHVLSAGYADRYYHTAQRAREFIRRAFQAALHTCNAILMPATPGPAFRLAEKTTDPLALYLEDVYTVSVNLAGLPAVSVPVASAQIDGKSLPIGMQLVGRPFDEHDLLALASTVMLRTR
ncbi:MAG: Asp-tRNA(Asn)/Glu-tRNA(Gln) amidotransferase subunit GatA [Phycisphaeraceae bacterium]|nr:Asp-tRNA(Asn)/Glu-tRNA(Gln) amidotransferase subunit GatA [Phycisphaeraceae bacterium]